MSKDGTEKGRAAFKVLGCQSIQNLVAILAGKEKKERIGIICNHGNRICSKNTIYSHNASV